MKKGFEILAAAAAVALLTPYDIEIDKENKTYKFKSFLLNVSVKQGQSESGEKNLNCDFKFSGKPTKEDIDTLKTNVTHVADESVKFAKETAEKVKSKFDRKEDGECCCDCDCDCDCEAEDAGDFCTEEEEKMF